MLRWHIYLEVSVGVHLSQVPARASAASIFDGEEVEEAVRDTSEDVRNYIAFTCLKTLMCPPTHPAVGASVLSPALLPWASAVQVVRKELGFHFGGMQQLKTALVWVAALRRTDYRSFAAPSGAPTQKTTSGSEGGKSLPLWGCAQAAGAVVVPLGKLFALVVLPSSKLLQQASAGEWGVCRTGTELRHVLPRAQWSERDVAGWLTVNYFSPWEPTAAEASLLARATQASVARQQHQKHEQQQQPQQQQQQQQNKNGQKRQCRQRQHRHLPQRQSWQHQQRQQLGSALRRFPRNQQTLDTTVMSSTSEVGWALLPTTTT